MLSKQQKKKAAIEALIGAPITESKILSTTSARTEKPLMRELVECGVEIISKYKEISALEEEKRRQWELEALTRAANLAALRVEAVNLITQAVVNAKCGTENGVPRQLETNLVSQVEPQRKPSGRKHTQESLEELYVWQVDGDTTHLTDLVWENARKRLGVRLLNPTKKKRVMRDFRKRARRFFASKKNAVVFLNDRYIVEIK